MASHFKSTLVVFSGFLCGILASIPQLEAQENRVVARPQAGKTRSFSLPVFNRVSLSDEVLGKVDAENTTDAAAASIPGLEALIERGSSRSNFTFNQDIFDVSEAVQDPVQTNDDEAPLAIPQDPDRVGPTIGRRPLRRPLSQVNIDIRTAAKRLPEDRAQEVIDSDAREWSDTLAAGMVYTWDAPDIHYRKLYFEDVALERYGQAPQGIWPQGVRSAIHWGGNLLALPLNMRLDPYYDCDTPLGFCRPGDCVPPTYQRYLRR